MDDDVAARSIATARQIVAGLQQQIAAEFIGEVAVRASPVGEPIEPLIVWRADERLEIVPEI